jgi:hypothetical protein
VTGGVNDWASAAILCCSLDDERSVPTRTDRGRTRRHTGNIVLGSLELPESNVDGDTTLTLGLELVQNPGVLERGYRSAFARQKGRPGGRKRWV